MASVAALALLLAASTASAAELRRGGDRLSLAVRADGSVAGSASFEGGAMIRAEVGEIETDLKASVHLGRAIDGVPVSGSALSSRGDTLAFNAGWSSGALDLVFGASQRRDETVAAVDPQPQLLTTQLLASANRTTNVKASYRATETLSLDLAARSASAMTLVDSAAGATEQASHSVGVISGAVWRPAPAFAVQTQVGISNDRVAAVDERETRFARSVVTPRLVATFAPSPAERLQVTAEQVASAPVLMSDAAGVRLQDSREWRVKVDARRPLVAGLALTTGVTLAARQGVTEFGVADGAQAAVAVDTGLSRRVDVGLTADLARLGLDGATLTGSGSLRRSMVDDPVTGDTRRASGEVPAQAQLTFAQSLPIDSVRWGLSSYIQGPTQYYGARDATRIAPVGGLGAFIDYAPGPVRMRLRVDNLVGGDRDSRIDYYDGVRGASEIDRVERRGTSGRAVSIVLSGKV